MCVWPRKAGKPASVIERLLRMALRLSSMHQRGLDTEFRLQLCEFEVATAELQRLDLKDLSLESSKAFYINTYNCMSMHAALCLKAHSPVRSLNFGCNVAFLTHASMLQGKSSTSRALWAKRVEYVVAEHTLSL